jgi:hypothetical protein
VHKPKPEISARAKRVWTRMREWYGVRVVDQYGETPPPDWCKAVDQADDRTVQRGLSLIRSRYVEHPPTLPQFEKVMQPPEGSGVRGPNEAVQLCEYVMKTRGNALTPLQVRTSWTYARDKMGELVVTVPADGAFPAISVTTLEMRSGQQVFA